jgi:hypothetical protein
MSLPTAVTQRAQGTGYIGVTGMEFAVQTGFGIRTGFYLTNSGTTTVRMTLEEQGDVIEAYDFISGQLNNDQDERVSILAGSTKFIPFDFYGLKDVSGPLGTTGPAGTGAYTTQVNLSFVSEIDGTKDRTYYNGQPELGVIRVDLTGYVTGHFGSTSELIPAHPQKFLGITNQKDDLGLYYHDLQWVNPPTGYYFEKYHIQRSTNATQTWSDLKYINIGKTEKPITLPLSEGGHFLESFYYGTSTGINGFNTYSDTSLTSNTDYYYRIRGEHYDTSNNLASYSDWVYCSGADSFEEAVNSDVLTGLVSGSTSLPVGGNPDPTIKLSTADKGALEIYLDNNETNVNLNSRFAYELDKRGINNANFTDYYTGAHFIVSENFIVGSNDSNSPAIDTGGKIEVGSSPQELNINLYVKDGARIIGHGGRGGNGGFTDVKWDPTGGGRINFSQKINSNDGGEGGDAIYIHSSISNFKIYLAPQFSVYAGGGGGGGGDRFFTSKIASLVRDVRDENDIEDNVSLSLQSTNDDINIIQGSRILGDFSYKDLVGLQTAGFGGGGQGYGRSPSGNTYSPAPTLSQIGTSFEGQQHENKGTLSKAGAGRALDVERQISEGGNGGAFGQFGSSGADLAFNEIAGDETILFNVNTTLNGGPAKGGRGGYAIKSDSNAYTKSNIMGTLLFADTQFQISEISGFIARWDANTTVYNTGTNGAANDETVETWQAAEVKTGLTISNVKITGGSTKPKFYSNISRTQYFNNQNSIEFDGNDTATIEGVQSSNLLSGNTEEFDFFYVVFPNSFRSGRQFKNDGIRNNSNYVFSKFSNGGYTVHQGIYIKGRNNRVGNIQESTGMPCDASSPLTSLTVKTEVETLPSYAFVYNVTAKKSGSSFLYSVYIDNEPLIKNKNVTLSNLTFDINPILGAYGGQKTSFNISDIVMYNKQLLPRERDSVYLTLSQRARKPLQIIISTSIDANTQNNTVEDNSGFAGYIKTTS